MFDGCDQAPGIHGVDFLESPDKAKRCVELSATVSEALAEAGPATVARASATGLTPARTAISRHFQKPVDISEAELAQPAELCFDVEQTIRPVLVLKRLGDCFEERQMEALSWRGDLLEVGEDSSGLEQI